MSRVLAIRARPRVFFAALVLAASGLPGFSEAAEDFPEPDGIKPAVAFWKRIYVEVTTDGGLLHDNEHLGVVYETVRLDGATGRRKERIKDERRDHWKGVLRRLARDPSPRSNAEREVLAAFRRALGREPTAHDLQQATQRIRFQLGQRDKFRQGLIRSGAYEDAMRAVFRRAGLPEDLAYLPHVESSFNTRAYSKYGAAGAWQFMRSTGRMYMRVDYEVDERLDPMVATEGAARLLGENYQALGSWPLALTAYNHGRAGMLRAKNQHGNDITRIIRRYQSRTFGFASRNFYAQFVAARKVMRSYESYFGNVKRDEPEAIDEIELPFYADVDDLQRYLGVNRNVIRTYNPALRPPVFDSNKRIPKGYVLRLPAGTVDAEPRVWLASLPASKRHAEQHRSRYYKVQRGDTLSAIARRHRTGVSTLASINGLGSRHRIYAGQVLRLPDGQRQAPERTFELVRTATAATQAPSVPAAKPERAPSPAPATQTARLDVPVPLPKPGAALADMLPPSEDQIEVAEAPEPGAPVTEAPAPEATAATPELPDAVAEADAPLVEAVPIAPLPKPALPEDSPFREIKNDRLMVDALETLGHYAEWLEIPTQQLRRINGLRMGQALQMGQQIKLDFSRVTHDQFVQRRTEYHKGIEEDFFGSFQVVGVVEHRIRRGDTIWKISNRTYDVPTWLIQRYNPEANLSRLTPGGKLVIPQVEPVSSSS